MISAEPNLTDTRPWVRLKAEAEAQASIDRVAKRDLSDAHGRAFWFALLWDLGAFSQQPTRPDFGASLLQRLMELDALGVGAMWAEGMTAKHTQGIEKKQ